MIKREKKRKPSESKQHLIFFFFLGHFMSLSDGPETGQQSQNLSCASGALFFIVKAPIRHRIENNQTKTIH